MQKTQIELPEIKLIGITTRTNNADEVTTDEVNPSVAKISPTVQRYFQGGLPARIPHRKKPGITFCAFTEYESDFTGNYTYFIGEEVSSFDGVPEGFKMLTIQPQTYAKLTSSPGPMPDVLIRAWEKIWQMKPGDFGGERCYSADFEVYDERAADPQNTVLDIYIGIK